MGVRLFLSAVLVSVVLFATADSCNVTLIARGSPSNLTSPGYPYKNYPSNLDCWWRIDASNKDSSIFVKVLDSVIETSKACVYDSLSFYDGPNSTDRSLGRLCGNGRTTFISTGSSIYILFKTDGDHELKGFNLEFYESTKCGGDLIATPDKTTFQSPGYPNQYFKNMNCSWFLTAKDPNDTIVVQFDHMDVQSSSGCVDDSVTVYNDHQGDGNQFLGTFCGYSTPRFQSSKTKLRIDFKTHGSQVGSGFTFHYRTVEAGVCNLTMVSDVNPLYIVSPGYPDAYENDLQCVWQIYSVHIRRNVEIDVIDSYIEGDYPQCDNDSLTIYSGLSQKATKLGTVCGNKTQTYTSAGIGMAVEFKTDDAVVNKGFRIRYSQTLDAPAIPTSLQCGTGTLTAHLSPNFIQSPRYPLNYRDNSLCIWTLTTVLANYMIRLEAVDSQMESEVGCAYDSVTVYDGVGSSTSMMLKRWCGNTQPTVQSSGQSMTVVFKSDNSVTGKGFRLKYTATSAPLTCGSHLIASGSTQYLTSPGYPENYPINKDCVWTITTNLRNIKIGVIDFHLEGSTNCKYDYLTLTAGRSTDSFPLQKLCGSHTSSYITTGPTVTIKFHSDASNTGQGFRLSYTAGSFISTSCGGQLTALYTDQVLTSPGFPTAYQNNLDCVWTITTDLSRIKISVTSLNMESSSNCGYDFLKVFDGSSIYSSTLGTLCGSQTSTYYSSSSTAAIKFHTDGSNTGRGFRLTYAGVMTSQCGDRSLVADTSTGYLTSPNYPADYSNNMDCTWTITTSLTNIKIHVLNTHLESNTGCTYDYVKVYDGSTTYATVLGTFCGTVTHNYVSSGTSVSIKFHSDTSNTFRGFRLAYTAGTFVQCGDNNLVANSVGSYIQSPNYPLDYPNNADCSWTIDTQDSDFIVSLDVISSDLEDNSGCTYDYYEIYDGVDDSYSSLGRYCGSSVPLKYSTGQFMFIKFKSDGSNVFTGFQMLYTSMLKDTVPDIPDPVFPNFNTDTDDYDYDTGPIAGGTVGGIFFVIFLIAVVVGANRRRNRPFVSMATPTHTSAQMTKW
ncbi:cubilin-like [Haliotis rufescens]|uniref:cubilin-like n=1 Tax=Haliotis rufescens TaxID=6454 RepID=UPI00201EFE94|nr:cubilin-like [Haliotis rufescens]